MSTQRRRDWTLEVLLLLYSGASLLHFVHNAELVHAYPNLPVWITRGSIYATWVALATVGLIGYGLYRLKFRAVGLFLLGLYAVAGLDGLLHYTRAPIGDHSHGMNFTIGFEVLMAAAFLMHLVASARRHSPEGA